MLEGRITATFCGDYEVNANGGSGYDGDVRTATATWSEQLWFPRVLAQESCI